MYIKYNNSIIVIYESKIVHEFRGVPSYRISKTNTPQPVGSGHSDQS